MEMSKSYFYCQLADELIENNYCGVSTRQVSNAHADHPDGMTLSSIGVQLTLTSRNSKTQDRSITNEVIQGRRQVCSVKK